MKVSIESNYDGNYSITVEDAAREHVLAIRKVTDEQQQITSPVKLDEIRYAEPRNWTREHQQAFIKAATLFFHDTPNKILTIKHIRSLSDPCLGLKDAKDLVDYAIGEYPDITWLKA